MIRAAALSSGARLLEVGSGTGRATRLFTGHGFDITCIEPVPEMAAVARESNGDKGSITYVSSTFEEWTPPEQPFDMAFSGQAFHWVDPAISYPKLANVVRPGGTVALFWYTPSLADPGLVEEVDRLYVELAAEIGSHLYRPSRFDSAGDHLRNTPTVHSVQRSEYREMRTDTTAAWLAMLGTTSDHLALPADRRSKLIDAIGEAIARRGEAEVRVVTRLWLATRV